MTNPGPSPFQTLRAMTLGYLPRLLQARGWVLCGLAILPVLLTLGGQMVSRNVEGYSTRLALQIFHGVLVSFILPIMALVLFGWENLLRILPATLQHFTFLHYIESITGTRGGMVAQYDLLAQTQLTSPVWVSAAVLLAFGSLCWGLAGWKLQVTPIGLAGMEGEG